MSFSFLEGCQKIDTKPMDFPKNDIKDGPGLLSGDKGYFNLNPWHISSPQQASPSNTATSSAPSSSSQEPASLDYEASH